jgi:hypothetical protein
MTTNKSSISQAQSYQEMGEFWDTHEVTGYWDDTEAIELEADIQSKVKYCALEASLAQQMRKLAHQKGVSVETLVNLWLQERIQAELSEVSTAA